MNLPERNCDMCGRSYIPSAKKIPRIMVIKRIDLDELTSKDYMACPDYCFNCSFKIITFLQQLRKLKFQVVNYASQNKLVEISNR